ncbi:MAG: hypothetical protein LAP21_24185 [Acidobacteriia bacterium]|nr:hypothetical protein [Terriglobia bacterium]
MTNIGCITKRYRLNGEAYWVDETGAEAVVTAETALVSLVEGSGNPRKIELREPSKCPLTKEQERVKETAKLLDLSEAEAEIFARGR